MQAACGRDAHLGPLALGTAGELAEHLDDADEQYPSVLKLLGRADSANAADIEDGCTLERGAPRAAEVAFLVGAAKLGAGHGKERGRRRGRRRARGRHRG